VKKKEKIIEEYDKIRKLLAYMDFATKVKIAQEELKKQRKPNK
jgi:catabolite regulation protein CreA